MIWIDSSFAIEWLLGTDRAKRVRIEDKPLGVLGAQYAETLIFFLRRGIDPLQTVNELEALELYSPRKIHFQQGSLLYFEARRNKSKASLSDALLAAVASEKGEPIASFDADFSFLGFKEKSGLWTPARD